MSGFGGRRFWCDFGGAVLVSGISVSGFGGDLGG